jgi:hypothetical protein
MWRNVARHGPDLAQTATGIAQSAAKPPDIARAVQREEVGQVADAARRPRVRRLLLGGNPVELEHVPPAVRRGQIDQVARPQHRYSRELSELCENCA